MNKSPLKRKQPSQYLSDLTKTSRHQKRPKGEGKRDKSYYRNFDQFFNFSFQFLLFKDVLFENAREEGEGGIEIDVLEI